MILFNSMFPVDKSLDRPVFLKMLREWLVSNTSYGFKELPDPLVLVDSVLEIAGAKGVQLHIYETETHLATQVEKRNQEDISRTTYILTEYKDRAVVFVRVECQNMVATRKSNIQKVAPVPTLVRNIMWQELGGEDDGLLISDKAVLLRKADLDLGKRILAADGHFFVPIVYITPMLANGLYMVNYDRLAAELAGQACVVVEATPVVSQKLAEEYPNKPLDGAIQIILPSGECELVHRPVDRHVASADIGRTIHNIISNAVNDVAVAEHFSFDRIKMSNLLAHDKNDELINLYESMLKDAEADSVQLRSELWESKQSLYHANSEALNYKHLFEQCRQGQQGDVSMVCKEQELYPGEITDVLLKLVAKEKQMMSDDPNMMGCRKYHVLCSLLENNEQTSVPADIRQLFVDTVSKNGVTSETSRTLERNGFQIEKSGGGHYKVTYQGDPRYQRVMANTPSDHRGNQNAVTDYMAMLFGY